MVGVQAVVERLSSSRSNVYYRGSLYRVHWSGRGANWIIETAKGPAAVEDPDQIRILNEVYQRSPHRPKIMRFPRERWPGVPNLLVKAERAYNDNDRAAFRDVVNQMMAATLQSDQVQFEHLLDLPTLTASRAPALKWLVEGLIPKAGITMIAARLNTYKTWIALELAKAASTGTLFCDRTTDRVSVLYADRENPLQVISLRCEMLGLEEGSRLRFWGGWLREQAPSFDDPRLLLMALHQQPLLIFDSFVRFHAAEENSATEMAAVMGKLRTLANLGATVLFLHHRAKSDQTKYRGSTDILAGVDVAYSIEVDKAHPGIIKLECFKNRFGEESSVTIQPMLQHGKFVVVDDPAHKAWQDANRELQILIAAEPGLSQKQLIAKSGLPKHKAQQLLKAGHEKNWAVKRGGRKTLHYYPLQQRTKN
jgi:hypothetical protein